MLYVNLEVNGVAVKAFVDSGAQMTIMTQEFAERCYLTRLIDKRFEGVARGVGTSKIIGQIHQVWLIIVQGFHNFFHRLCDTNVAPVVNPCLV